jgi:hypothetical protein
MLKHIDAFVLSWHKLITPIMVEIGLLRSQPFMNSHFHFLIIVKLAVPKVLHQWPKISFPKSVPSPKFTSIRDMFCQLAQLSSLLFV